MPRYEPRELDFAFEDFKSLQEFMIQEFRNIAANLIEVDGILLPELHAAPNKPRDGMIVLADGSDWDPGSGAGFYGRSSSAWVKLG